MVGQRDEDEDSLKTFYWEIQMLGEVRLSVLWRGKPQNMFLSCPYFQTLRGTWGASEDKDRVPFKSFHWFVRLFVYLFPVFIDLSDYLFPNWNICLYYFSLFRFIITVILWGSYTESCQPVSFNGTGTGSSRSRSDTPTTTPHCLSVVSFPNNKAFAISYHPCLVTLRTNYFLKYLDKNKISI